jgi:hypothetical protein
MIFGNTELVVLSILSVTGILSCKTGILVVFTRAMLFAVSIVDVFSQFII